MTVVSTPASSSRMAAVCRSTWAVMCFWFSDGQRALRRCVVTGESALDGVAGQ